MCTSESSASYVHFNARVITLDRGAGSCRLPSIWVKVLPVAQSISKAISPGPAGATFFFFQIPLQASVEWQSLPPPGQGTRSPRFPAGLLATTVMPAGHCGDTSLEHLSKFNYKERRGRWEE